MTNCSSLPRREDSESNTLSGSGQTGRNAAPGTLNELAEYLRTGYWIDSGATPREYNLGSNGSNANFGVLTFNVSGFSLDRNGISEARKELVREAFKLYEEVLGIRFIES